MMEGRPYKFRILEILDAEGPTWNRDLVKQLQMEYNMPSDYYRDCLNFDLIEVAASGMVAEGETLIDEEGTFRKGRLLIQYHITPLGLDFLNELRSKVKPRKGE
ncbi:MAG: hypothetical protein FWH45_00465 [Methanomassiliicoccaceae archaeon]|nr:hypothetical protein [Methanomassiliicoccaceae archaeon]MCL2145646.1 hypothetical protein [Methanomassiliicoccaceae archaeon]